ncbi:MAG: hypothetical protein FWD98_01585 [Defluviitaleaceae bacterium]|nr:hypothetical protein [Defluviitaleaceae bacterium]
MSLDKLLGGIRGYGHYIFIITAALSTYSLIYTFSEGFGILAHNWYNSYSLQAYSWLQGRLDIPEDRPWLEIAFFGGRNYISFPPFPSMVLLPFVAVFGTETPDHAIAMVCALVSLIFAYKIAFKHLNNKDYAAFFSLFLILGTNYLHLSLWGAVWWLAQNMAFMFTLMAFYLAMSDDRRHSYIALFAFCAAMGCRPFNAVYLPLLLYMLYKREGLRLAPYTKKLLVYAVPAIMLGCVFMWLNYARFGSVFEFGHNYLPEFVWDYHGQFHFSRMARNLTMIFLGTDIAYGIRNGFPFYGRTSFAFWLASPIVISYVVYLCIYAARKKDGTGEPAIWMIPLMVMLHILAFSLHRTLGGRQFGSRYAADSLPAIYLGLVLMLARLPLNNRVYLNLAPLIFGKMINFHGTIMFLTFYFGE